MRANMREKRLRELRAVATFELAGVRWECRNGEHVEAISPAPECGADAREEVCESNLLRTVGPATVSKI